MMRSILEIVMLLGVAGGLFFITRVLNKEKKQDDRSERDNVDE